MSRSEEEVNKNEERNQITTSIMKTEYVIKALERFWHQNKIYLSTLCRKTMKASMKKSLTRVHE